MKNKTIQQMKEKLLSQRAELQELEATQKESGQTVELDQARVGRLSRMDAMQGQQMALEAIRRREHQFMLIEGALRRIESGEYGYCLACGDEIDARRLFLDPAYTHCVDCADKS